MGIEIVRFEVDCEGKLKNLRITNPLRWGIEAEIQKFMNATVGNWNKCDDDKYTMYYRISISNIKEYNADFDSYSIIPNTMIKLLTICRKIEQKVKMIKWKCNITHGDSPDGIVIYIYKNIEV